MVLRISKYGILPSYRELSRSAAQVIPPLIVAHPNGQGVSAFPPASRVGSSELLGGFNRTPHGETALTDMPTGFKPVAVGLRVKVRAADARVTPPAFTSIRYVNGVPELIAAASAPSVA